MKPGYIAVLFFTAQALICTGEPAAIRAVDSGQTNVIVPAPKAWLGIRLEKPDAAVTSQIPSLPPGIGFLVKSVEEGGPAQVSGLKNLDLVWKLGDQMLVNEAQLAALLRLSKPGDEIVVSGFRSGKAFESKLKLGEAPVLKHLFPGPRAEYAGSSAACEGPVRLVNVAKKSASFSSDAGKAVVWRDGEVFNAKIKGPDEKVIFDGPLSTDGNFSEVPEAWQGKIMILSRTLKQTLDGKTIPERQARPRIVPAPLQATE